MAKRKAEEEQVDLLGQLTVELDGTEYLLRPSRQALSEIERQTGNSLAQLATLTSGLALSVEHAGVCVAEMMKAVATNDSTASADYKGAKPERCADLIFETGLIKVLRRLAIIFTGALTGGYTASGEVKAATRTEPTPIAA